MAFYVGKAIRLSNWSGPSSSPSGGYRNSSGTLVDPSVPALKYRLPGASTVSLGPGQLTRDGTGLYSATVIPTEDGDAIAVYTSSDGAYSEPVTWKIEPAHL